jgi:hypothetical protein
VKAARIESALPTHEEVVGLAHESTANLVTLLSMAVRVGKTRSGLAALLALSARGAAAPDAELAALLRQLADWRAFAMATLAAGNRAHALQGLHERGTLTPLQEMVGLYVRARIRSHGTGPGEHLLGEAVLDRFTSDDRPSDAAMAAGLRDLLDHTLSRPILDWLPLESKQRGPAPPFARRKAPLRVTD